MSRGIKLCAMSIGLATFAPLILLSLWVNKKVGYRVRRFLRLTHFHASRHRDLWTREITLYEVVFGEMPPRWRK